jgi:hypothetical protein
VVSQKNKKKDNLRKRNKHQEYRKQRDEKEAIKKRHENEFANFKRYGVLKDGKKQ